MTLLCGCEDVDRGYDKLIRPELMPPPPPTMYPADQIARWIQLYGIAGGPMYGLRDMQPVADSSDVVVALVQQHKAALLQAVDAVASSEDLDQLLLEAYTSEKADPYSRSPWPRVQPAMRVRTVRTIKKLLLAVYNVEDAESVKAWLSSTVNLLCSCQFTKLASLQLYALHGLVKQVDPMCAIHLLAMQDLLNYLYFANTSLFDRNFHSIEMEQDDIVLIKPAGL